MNDTTKIIASIVAMIVVITAVSLTVKYFSQPISRAIDQKTFMESQQYVDGSIRDLQRYYLEYQKADAMGKVVIKTTIIHQFANFPSEKVPTHLKAFHNSIMSGGQP